MNKKIINVAIDGYSKCGKSTLAKKIANKYHFLYIDSGALYRFVTYLSKDLSLEEIEQLPFSLEIEQLSNGDILYKGKKYTDKELGCKYVNEKVSSIAQNPMVRQKINEWILNKSKSCSVAMDGRDIGTEVLPNAQIKLFLFASVDYRMSQWRKNQLAKFGGFDESAETEERNNIISRDRDDETRKIAPLACARDAIRINVEEMSFDDMFSFVCKLIDKM